MKIYVKLVEIMHCFFKTVYMLLARFSVGKTDTSDEARSGRPHEATDPYHIEKEGSP